ncbi:MAG: CPBP family intramembrane metalloprotease [Proteobacteria bacterium]|nr:MAG: CPBP family intramembrane metalloprotease [Pseudomonadota bacterium]
MDNLRLKKIFMAVTLSILPMALSLSDIVIYDALRLKFDFAAYVVCVALLQLLAAVFVFTRFPSNLTEPSLKTDVVLKHIWFVCFGLATIFVGAIVTTLGNKIFFALNFGAVGEMAALNPVNSTLSAPTFLAFVLTVLLAPLIEELVFRQLLLKMWTKIVSTFSAIVMVSIFFTLLHVPYPLVSLVALYK